MVVLKQQSESAEKLSNIRRMKEVIDLTSINNSTKRHQQPRPVPGYKNHSQRCRMYTYISCIQGARKPVTKTKYRIIIAT
jgi:hypothetical protein